MYLITKYGWYSVVAAMNDHGRPNPEKIVIRARSVDHFKRLSAAGCPGLAGLVPDVTPDRDYFCRIVVSKDTWFEISAFLSAQVTYTNVKEHLSRIHGAGSAFSKAVHQAWAAGWRTLKDRT